MAQLRVRFRFNPGGTGAPMDKLGSFAVQTEKFLRSLTRDLGLPAVQGLWLARNFTNESVAFDSEYADAVPEPAALRGNKALELLTGHNPLEACDRQFVGFRTALEFAEIGKSLKPSEQFFVGLYRADEEPEWRSVSYSQIKQIEKLLDAPVQTYGSVQGTFHSWATGANPAFFQLRELSTGDLIKCTYSSDLHSKILAAHKRERTVIHVYGGISWSRTKDTIIEIKVSDIEETDPLSPESFERLFGSMPNFTEDLTTSEFIDQIRNDGE
jgi:hypothetical protein